MRSRTSAALAALALACLPVSACTVTAPAQKGAGQERCAWLNRPKRGDAARQVTSQTVFLVDVSASASPARGVTGRMADVTSLVADAIGPEFTADGERLVSIGTFDGASPKTGWQAVDAALPYASGGDARRAAQEESVVDCVAAAVSATWRSTPMAEGTDVLGALAQGGEILARAAVPHRRLVVITDGLSNSGCLDLRKILKEGNEPGAALRACGNAKGLNSLEGVRVSLYGIGMQASGRPLASEHAEWLKGFWRDVCASLRTENASTCVQPPGKTSDVTGEIDRVDDPDVVFPEISTKGDRLEIPSELLFATGSAALGDRARAVLDQIAAVTRRAKRSVARVIGHTDSRASAAYNKSLSERRARAVLDYLVTKGVADAETESVGLGETRLKCADEFPGGTPDDRCLQANRRVEIVYGKQT
ncbi:OmpA family protein [Streptosporangium carneum]|uniref:OmpA-like domain-containing protein n=1 Tax=Streptosporangium carneum TaxID=47481 RepID=A0A9W6I307_9ACTN|nr:OmpA family protein [Streptosporangium carneum]GLK11100.1 hypothetical protein GCM10017600_45060 [Streptosporangium carneum]